MMERDEDTLGFSIPDGDISNGSVVDNGIVSLQEDGVHRTAEHEVEKSQGLPLDRSAQIRKDEIDGTSMDLPLEEMENTFDVPVVMDGEADVSTLGETYNGSMILDQDSTNGFDTFRKHDYQDMLAYDGVSDLGTNEPSISRYAENEYCDDDDDDDDIGQRLAMPWLAQKNDNYPQVEFVSTQDTSNMEESSQAKYSPSSEQSIFTYRRLAYIAFCILGPVLIGAVVGLAFVLIGMKDDAASPPSSIDSFFNSELESQEDRGTPPESPSPSLSPILNIDSTFTPTMVPSIRTTTRIPNNGIEAQTNSPTLSITERPTTRPTIQPTISSTDRPTLLLTTMPTKEPSREPTVNPTRKPTVAPTFRPSFSPTQQIILSSPNPTFEPVENTMAPTKTPTAKPTARPTTPITKTPTVKPTAEPTESPTRKPTATPTLLPTRKPTVLPTATPTLFPTRTPTMLPTARPTISPTLVPTQSPVVETTPSPTIATSAPVNPTQAPVQPTEAPVNPTLPPQLSVTLPEYPEERFVTYQEFRTRDDDFLLRSADLIGYTESGWNIPFPDEEPEESSFLQIRRMGTFGRYYLETMGFTDSASWDCWVNHYWATEWDDMPRLPEPRPGNDDGRLNRQPTEFGQKVQTAYESLGWSRARWIDDQSVWPESQFKSWDELTQDEQMAAISICWTQRTWDKVPISQW